MSLTLQYFYERTKNKYSLTLHTVSVSLQRKITWVHMVEDPENCSFIRGGELIVSTGLEMKNQHDMMNFVKKVCQSKASGLILNQGPYIKEVPESVIKWCQENDFPLFSMPWEVHIADLMQEYCNAIISEKRVQDIRADLLKAALQDRLSEEERKFWDSLGIQCIAASDHELSIPCAALAQIEDTYYYGLEQDIAQELQRQKSLHDPLGISELISEENKLSDYKEQALHALLYAKKKEKTQAHFHELGLYHLALQCQDENSIRWAKNLLAPIRDENLRRTFLSYLEHDGSVVEVAEELYLHRNTVNYRLQKIRNILPEVNGVKKAEYLMAFYILEICQN